jgi:MYXO-CTERM domain-containing protein
VGSKVNFKGSCNFEGDSGTTSLGWSFGAGAGIAASSLANPSVVFSKAGNFSTILSCKDSTGTGMDQVHITVTALPSGGGGGAPGPLTLVLLCTLAAFHRRRRNA